MIEPSKLFQLDGGQKRRKLALTFGALERDIAGIAEKGTEYNFKAMPRSEYTKKLAEILLKDPKLPPQAATELKSLLSENPFDELRVCNYARNQLLAIIGTPCPQTKTVLSAREIFFRACAFLQKIFARLFTLAQYLEPQKVLVLKKFIFLQTV